MNIPFVKAHGARNDFLLTWRHALPCEPSAEAARAICERNTGVGADGWMIVARSAEADGAIELWNSDGSRSEISGNGTRCAAALLVAEGLAGEDVRIMTGAGVKHLRTVSRAGKAFTFEMNMGVAVMEDLRSAIVPGRQTTLLNVGNPQCAVFVENFDFDWADLGAKLERHPHFPNRTNVSFLRVVDHHALEVRFFERGAGVTMSSGTGSTGAGAAAVARGLVSSPVEVRTPAGPLALRWEGEEIYLTGPAELTSVGEYYWNP